jgi:hypothetical protein
MTTQPDTNVPDLVWVSERRLAGESWRMTGVSTSLEAARLRMPGPDRSERRNIWYRRCVPGVVQPMPIAPEVRCTTPATLWLSEHRPVGAARFALHLLGHTKEEAERTKPDVGGAFRVVKYVRVGLAPESEQPEALRYG